VDEHPNVAAARASIDAYRVGDLDAFTGSLHEEVVWHAPGANRYSGDFVGKAAVMDRFRQQAEGGVTLRFEEVHDVVGNDRHVVALIDLAVTGPGGQSRTPAVFVMHVEEGTLREFWGMNERQAEVDAVING
jgi:ketosteroid isomerase-like protein